MLLVCYVQDVLLAPLIAVHLNSWTIYSVSPPQQFGSSVSQITESTSIFLFLKIFQELQAKLAAQKLAEGLTVSMNSYNPEGGALAAYREVHDDGALSEED